MDPNAEKFDADFTMRSIKCREQYAVEYDTVVLNMETYTEDIMRKKAYGDLIAVMPMRFPPMP